MNEREEQKIELEFANGQKIIISRHSSSESWFFFFGNNVSKLVAFLVDETLFRELNEKGISYETLNLGNEPRLFTNKSLNEPKDFEEKFIYYINSKDNDSSNPDNLFTQRNMRSFTIFELGKIVKANWLNTPAYGHAKTETPPHLQSDDEWDLGGLGEGLDLGSKEDIEAEAEARRGQEKVYDEYLERRKSQSSIDFASHGKQIISLTITTEGGNQYNIQGFYKQDRESYIWFIYKGKKTYIVQYLIDLRDSEYSYNKEKKQITFDYIKAKKYLWNQSLTKELFQDAMVVYSIYNENNVYLVKKPFEKSRFVNFTSPKTVYKGTDGKFIGRGKALGHTSKVTNVVEHSLARDKIIRK
jgi:hypothetical protein